MRWKNSSGMTLLELVVFSIVGLALVGMVFGMWTFAYKNWAAERTLTGLRVDLEVAMEKIKSEVRLSNTVYASLYKDGGSGDYIAISFPSAPLDANGFYTLDGSGNILWEDSIIYHVYSGELRRTVFSDNGTVLLSQADRESQLNSVVSNGDGSGWTPIDGETSATKTIVENVNEFKIYPSNVVFDGYNPILKRSDNVEFGSYALDTGYAAGYHDFRFTVEDNNASSSGYEFGIDLLSIAPAGCEREAEFYSPLNAPHSHAGGTASKIYNIAFSGNNFLEYTASAIGSFVNLRLYYDLWRESNFQNAVRVNTIITGNDLYVKLADLSEGLSTTWEAGVQTGSAMLDYDAAGPVPISLADIAVRNVIDSASIDEDSDVFRVKFFSHSSNTITIEDVYLDERNAAQNAIDPSTSGTRIQLYFTSGGNVVTSETIAANDYRYSNWAVFDIDSSKDYFVTFRVSSGFTKYWLDPVSANIHSYMVYDAASVWATAEVWPAPLAHQAQPPPDAIPVNECFSSPAIYVTSSIEAWSETGTVVSEIYDTTLADPVYNNIEWSESAGSPAITLYARSSDNSDMSGSSWDAGSGVNPHSIAAIGTGRFFQFMAGLATTPYWTCISHPGISISDVVYKAGSVTCTTCGKFLIPAVDTPWVDDVAIDWPGPARICDVSGYFAQKSNYGMISLQVDGNDMRKGYDFDLTLSNTLRGVTYQEALSVEVEPRNSGN